VNGEMSLESHCYQGNSSSALKSVLCGEELFHLQYRGSLWNISWFIWNLQQNRVKN